MSMAVRPLYLYTWYYYDAAGNLQYVVNPMEATANRPITFSSSPNYTTEYVHDNLGRKIEEIQPDPDGGGNRPTTVYAYDANGNLSSVTDPLGNVTRYAYDPRNRAVQTTDALGASGATGGSSASAHTTTTVFDAVGNALFAIDAVGSVTSYSIRCHESQDQTNVPSPIGRGPG